MSSDLITFSQVVAKARYRDEDINGKASPDLKFGKRAKTRTVDAEGQARPEPVASDYQRPSDRALASRVTGAIAQLQDAMDTAIRAGLMVEPKFKAVSGRFNEFGVSIDSHICTVQIYRKLA